MSHTGKSRSARLPGRRPAGPHRGPSRCFLHQPLGLLDEPLDCVALLAGGLLADRLEHLVQLLDLPLRLREVILGRFLQLCVFRRRSHFGQSLGNRVLRVIHVLEGMFENIGQCLHHDAPLPELASGESGSEANGSFSLGRNEHLMPPELYWRLARFLAEPIEVQGKGGNMENPGVGWIAAIVIGGVAGWLAEMFMKSNMGVLMNIILGIVGAIVANVLLGLLGVSLAGWLGYLVAGFIGACILIAVARMVKR